jgi:predicted amidohydrolase
MARNEKYARSIPLRLSFGWDDSTVSARELCTGNLTPAERSTALFAAQKPSRGLISRLATHAESAVSQRRHSLKEQVSDLPPSKRAVCNNVRIYRSNASMRAMRMQATNPFRIALANLRFPESAEDSVDAAVRAVHAAAACGAKIICFPECFVPGYRLVGRSVRPPDADFLERAWSTIAQAAGNAEIAVVLGTERVTKEGLRISALVINADGSIAGFQDKVQLDPSEDSTYAPGDSRRVFQTGPLTFGISICHEGFRYPETVRFAARQGAQIVFHPHVHVAEPGSYQPTKFGDPANTFHEKSALCRAAENTCYFATVNCASDGSGTTSAIIQPDGTLLCYQPYGEEGLLIDDIDLSAATGLLASRLRPVGELKDRPTLLSSSVETTGAPPAS